MPSRIKSKNPAGPQYGGNHKLIGKDYQTADLIAKVTGQSEVRRGLSGRGHAVLQAAAQPRCRTAA